MKFAILINRSFHVKRCKKGLFPARPSSISLKIGIFLGKLKVFDKKAHT
jgi:hypothetical protein